MSVKDEIRQKINKKRWERWRAQQNKERQKTYFFCWNEWSDYCEDTDTSPNLCAYARVQATLYAATDRVKIHYTGTCCAGPECGNCIYNCWLRTRICTTEIINSGYCTPWQQENFGYFVCTKSGDHWHDIEEGWEEYEHKAYVDVYCNCAAASNDAHASCRVQEGT